MKNLFLTLSLAFITLISIQAQKAPSWNVDADHSSVEFSIKHLFSNVTGRFGKFEGDLKFDPNNLKGSSADFTIYVKSINTHNDKRDSHLKSDDFFDAEKHPTIIFKSKKFFSNGKDSYVLHGDLTIKGITKQVAINFNVEGVMDSPWVEGVEIMGITGTTTIDRGDFEVGSGSWAATATVGGKVDITIHLEVDREK